MQLLINNPKNELEINTMSPLVWAYIGDGVYELFIRTYLIETTKLNPHYLHIETTKYVKAKAQAEILQKIDKYLSEEEKEIVRRGRNAQNHHLPKNSDLYEYSHATAFEGLIGYLYLTGENERLNEILDLCIK